MFRQLLGMVGGHRRHPWGRAGVHGAAAAGPAFRLSPAVQEALALGLPVVALESTIISHGMPYPQNLTMARAVEAVVREEGCIPATIALLGGVVRVGLEAADLERLARGGQAARKTSRRDMALVRAAGGDGATTVSGTLITAHKAGIRVFVTGGLGGVHRELRASGRKRPTKQDKIPERRIC